jgi:hypothetical protein
MRPNVFGCVVLFALRAPAGADVIPPQKVEGKIDWVYSYAEGQRLARANHKPLFVVFRCER